MRVFRNLRFRGFFCLRYHANRGIFKFQNSSYLARQDQPWGLVLNHRVIIYWKELNQREDNIALSSTTWFIDLNLAAEKMGILSSAHTRCRPRTVTKLPRDLQVAATVTLGSDSRWVFYRHVYPETVDRYEKYHRTHSSCSLVRGGTAGPSDLCA